MPQERDFYDHQIRLQEAGIEKLRGLRDAQVEESTLYNQFQELITEATYALQEYRAEVPRARELDDLIDHADRVLIAAERDQEFYSGGWSRAGVVCVVPGVLVLLTSLIVTFPMWMPVIGGSLMLAAAGCGVASVISHRNTLVRITEAHRTLREVEIQRQALVVEPPR